MSSFPLQIKVSSLVLIGLIMIESTGGVCGLLSLCWNLLSCLKHMAKSQMVYQKEF